MAQSGTAFLYVQAVVAIVLLGLVYIVLTPTVNDIIVSYNTLSIGGQHMTQQSWSVGYILRLVWSALPALGFVIIAVGTYIRQSALKV